MAYVITQRCCNDATCIAECPVDCIRPTPDDPQFTTAEMLYIDPTTCIDCGACADACPVGAIFPEDELAASLERYRTINADYFDENPLTADLRPIEQPSRPPTGSEPLRVAIVGTGPSACYAAEELLNRGAAELSLFDRLPTPWGLIRSGVAPDHASTKEITDRWARTFNRTNIDLYLNTSVGTDVTHDELLAHHHAVIYAVGASTDRHLGIPGEDLAGSHSATEFVAWYNGHPDYADFSFDLTGERAVIVGNGNVALDVARVLTMNLDELAKTDIADHALEALRHSNIREVVLLGRRGTAHAAYSTPEFLALEYLDGVDVVIDGDAGTEAGFKVELAREYAKKQPSPENKRIVFRYLVSPVEICGDQHVASVTIAHNELTGTGRDARAQATDRTESIDTGLILRSIGYRGQPISGLPFDDEHGVVPSDRVEPGIYVTGWIKRGPRGVIGTNRLDAAETVDQIIADFAAGALTSPVAAREDLKTLVGERNPDVVDHASWAAIDRIESDRGKSAGRPRVKITSRAELLAAARP